MIENIYKNRIGFFEGEQVNNNVSCFIINNAKKTPDKKVLMWLPEEDKIDAGKKVTRTLSHASLTFSEFEDAVNRISTGLKKLGIGKGDRIIIFIPMSKELYQCMNAVMKIGAVSVFLDPWATPERLGLSAALVEPKAMISFEGAFDYCNPVKELAEIPIKIAVGPRDKEYTSCYEMLITEDPSFHIEPVKGDHTALITFTTGSSGIPKGADRSHQFLAAQHYAINDVIPYEEGDLDIAAFPIFCLNNMAAGVTTVLPSTSIGPPTLEDHVRLASQILTCKASCATLSIPMVEGLAEYSKTNSISFPELRRAATGGAPVSNDLITDFIKIIPNAEFLVMYGSTEAEPMAHVEARKKIQEESSVSDLDKGVIVGNFARNMNTKLIKIHKDRIELENDDWTPWEVEEGEVGELLVTGPHVCQKYYNNIEAAKDNKVFESNGTTWHRTGDLSRIDKKGQAWIVGRMHNVISKNNTYYFPVKIEILLKELDFVEKSAFVGVPDDTLGEKAYIIVSPQKPMTNEEKKQGIKEIENLIKNYQIPADGIFITEDIPMDPRHHSKVEYPVLRQRIKDGKI